MFLPQLFYINPVSLLSKAKAKDCDIVPDVADPAIFLLQHVMVNKRQLLMFYNSGCMGAAINKWAAAILDTECVCSDPTFMSVAGATTTEISTGDERFALQMNDKKSVATLTVLRMPEITIPFPTCSLEDVWAYILKEYGIACPSLFPGPKANQWSFSRHNTGDQIFSLFSRAYLWLALWPWCVQVEVPGPQ